MAGFWRDGISMTYGGSGYNPSSTDYCKYMFPGDSDPLHYGTDSINYGFNWSETLPLIGGNPNNPGDRRFLMSSGKFTLIAGSVNTFTKAAVWARTSYGIDSSLQALKNADDRIQAFFDSDFTSIPVCNNTMGVDQLSEINFSVYPNPANDVINFITPEYENLLISFYSSEGKLFLKDQNVEKQLSVSEWPAGIYFYIVKEKSGKHKQGKITILKN